jgi:polysaccharide biosynthesis PFTS motif protein
MVREERMKVEDTGSRGEKARESLLLFLEESTIAVEYHPIILEYLNHIFMLENSNLINGSGDSLHANDATSFNILTRTLRVSKKRTLRGIFRLILFAIALILASCLPQVKRKHSNTILLFGFQKELLGSEDKILSLVKNLSTKIPNLFDDATQVLFESRESAISSFLFSKSATAPVLALRVMREHFSIISRWKIVLSVFKMVLKTIRRNFSVFFIAPERIFLEFPIWRMIIPQMNLKAITTQSKLELLPALFYVQEKNRSMVWYSNNSLPFKKRGEETRIPLVASNAGFIDHHFVWSESHREFLKFRYPKSEISVVGPITFETSSNRTFHQPISKVILYFDVTPFDNLEYETFYTTEMCINAIKDLTEAAANFGMPLHLKPKRLYLLAQKGKLQHSGNYIKLLYKLESEKLLKLLDARVGIENEIRASQLVIGLPFTSPVLISSHLERPSFYYVPSNAGEWELPPERDGIVVVQGKIRLNDYLKSLISEEN